MLRILKSRKSTWLFASSVWLLCLPICWQGAPYRLLQEWPAKAGKHLIGFLPGEDALLAVYLPFWQLNPPEDDRIRMLNRLDLKTGEIRELFRVEEHFQYSPLLADGRWLAIYCKDAKNNPLIFIEVATGRQLEFQIARYNYPYAFTGSPSGQYLAVQDGYKKLLIFDLAGEIPKIIDQILIPKELGPGPGQGFDIDDRGNITIACGRLPGKLGPSQIARFQGDSKWKILYEAKDDESIASIFRDRFGKLLIDVRTPGSASSRVIDPENGLEYDKSGVTTKPDAVVIFERDPLRQWIGARFPKLGISTTHRQLKYTPLSGRSYTLASSLLQRTYKDTQHVETLSNPSFIAVADDYGVHLFDNPPRKSLPWFALLWLACGLPIFGIVYLRDRAIRKSVMS